MKYKTFKKILISLILSTLVLVTTLSGLKSTPKYMGGIQKVTFFSQTPVYRDKGFNQATFYGASDYANYSKQMIGNQATKSFSSDGENYVSEITNLYDMGVETIISSGFNTANAFSADKSSHSSFDGIWKKTPKYNSKHVVIIDDSTLSRFGKNAVSIGFKAEDGGFMAGIASCIYVVDLISHNNYHYKPSITLWGGFPYDVVYGLLSGFEQGINWFNYQILGFNNIHDGNLKKKITANSWKELVSDREKSLNWNGLDSGSKNTPNAFKKIKEPIKINNGGSIDGIDYSKPAPKGSRSGDLSKQLAEKSFYTGGFTGNKNDGEAGSNAYKKIQNSNKNKNSIVFPVAGAQTIETLSLLENHSKTMVIGVDSDASISAPNYADNILGSSIKNIRKSANYGAWYADNNVKENGVPKGTIQKYLDFVKNEDLSPSGEGNGWKVKDPSIIGSQFRGTQKNGGVGFKESKSNLTKAIKDISLIDDNKSLWKFKDFLKKIAFKLNTKIENASNTFHIPNSKTKLITKEEKWPWIPDWENKYNR